MTFLHEADDVRAEVRFGASDTIRVFPKVNGAPVDAAGISDASVSIFEPEGVEVQTATVAATSTTFGSRTVAFYDVPVVAINEVEEDYILRLTWSQGGVTRVEVVTFDVVVAPLGGLVSINDMQALRPDVFETLVRIGKRLGETTSDQASAEFAARVFATTARQQTVANLRSRAERDGSIRASQILDRRELARVEAQYAMAEVYRSIADAPDEGEDRASQLFRMFRRTAEQSFAAMRVAYKNDTDEELQKAGETTFGSVYRMNRVQG